MYLPTHRPPIIGKANNWAMDVKKSSPHVHVEICNMTSHVREWVNQQSNVNA